MKGNRTGLVLIFVLLLSLASTAFSFDFSEIEDRVVEFTLDNGLKFIVLPRHDAPVASFVTQVDAGCADDPKGAMGQAHMFEHMAFKGTREIGTTDLKKELKWMAVEDSLFNLILKERAKRDLADSARLAELDAQMKIATDSAASYSKMNEFSELVSAQGGTGLNAGTGYDNTTYYVNYPSNKLELWMAMESDRFANPVLRELFKEKQVVAEERRYRVESSPTGRLLFGEYLELAFNAHPYGMCMIGEMSEIQDYNRPQMIEHFKEYYVPRNIVIAIVGDVDPKEVKKLAEKYFGPLEDKPDPKPVMVIEPDPFGIREVTLHENSQPLFVMGYHIPAITHPDYLALDALATYLGSGRTSVLYKDLVKEKKSAVSVQAFAGYPANKYPTLFNVFCIPSNESTNAENLESVLQHIERVRTELIPVEELDKIKAQAKAQLINTLASSNGLANQLVSYQTKLGDWRKLFQELDRVNALTPEDIKRVAEKYLDPEKRIIAYLEKPEEGI
ncbi:MAG: insulinase family protein [candidate division Zixibacteria bacterium]|nr:insulinase family protein [candidate division Zixibacteria bacterium]